MRCFGSEENQTPLSIPGHGLNTTRPNPDVELSVGYAWGRQLHDIDSFVGQPLVNFWNLRTSVAQAFARYERFLRP